MNANILKLFSVILIATFFSSCGDDDKDSEYDKSYIVGNYSGTCTVSYGSKGNFVYNKFPVNFVKDSKDTSILLAMIGDSNTIDETALGDMSVTASHFKSNSLYAYFRMSSISDEFSSSNIPSFIRELAPLYDIQKAVLTLSCNDVATYEPNSGQLSFEYTGKVVITSKDGQSSTVNLSYAFDLKK